MKRILPLLLILLLILTGCSAQNADSPAADAPTDTPLTGTFYVQIDVKDYGTIEAGKVADIIAIEGDPLQDISCVRKVRTVYKAGEKLKG